MPTTPFAAALKRHRTRRGLTQRTLAAAAGIHANTLARFERGELEPAWATVCRLADALRIPVGKFRQSASPCREA